MKQTAAKGHTAKHASTSSTSKKHGQAQSKKTHPAKQKAAPKKAGQQKVHAKAKQPAHAKARQLARGDVQRDLLRLWPASGGEAEPRQLLGASSWAYPLADVACCSVEALAASLRLCGRPCGADDVWALHSLAGGSEDAGVSILAALQAAGEYGLAGVRPAAFRVAAPGDWSVILGLELPGPHAVLAETGRWWSWCQPWPPAAFPDAVIEEAWAVVWP